MNPQLNNNKRTDLYFCGQTDRRLIVVPKNVNPEQIKANIQILD